VTLWSGTGVKLAAVELGAQVTSVSAQHPRIAVAGTNRGFVEVLLLPTEGDGSHGGGVGTRARSPLKYETYFEDAAGTTVLRAAEHPEAFARLLAPADDAIAEATGTSDGGSDGDTRKGSGGAEGDEAARLMAKGLAKGGRLMSEEEEAAEVAARAKPKPPGGGARPELGDLPGVARDATVPTVETRTCASTTCITQAVGKKKFLRCARCKLVWYCSAHCQRTHWRDGHSKACALRGEAAAAAEAAAEAAEGRNPEGDTGGGEEAQQPSDAADRGATDGEPAQSQKAAAEQAGVVELPPPAAAATPLPANGDASPLTAALAEVQVTDPTAVDLDELD
jgi:hypothetical protein